MPKFKTDLLRLWKKIRKQNLNRYFFNAELSVHIHTDYKTLLKLTEILIHFKWLKNPDDVIYMLNTIYFKEPPIEDIITVLQDALNKKIIPRQKDIYYLKKFLMQGIKIKTIDELYNILDAVDMFVLPSHRDIIIDNAQYFKDALSKKEIKKRVNRLKKLKNLLKCENYEEYINK